MDYLLNDTWILWYHSFKNSSWEKDSYVKCGQINSIQILWEYINNIHDLKKGMFFLMRKKIFPKWEEPENINGGAWTLSISSKDAKKNWIELMLSLVGETLTDDMDQIHGISITPKRKYVIIKIWNKNSNKQNLLFNNSKINWKSKQYRKHLKRNI